LEINKTSIRTLSILGQRGTLGVTLSELAKSNDKLVAITADLCNTSGLDRFQTDFPDRLFNVGIAEQNMIGIAAGLAAGGNIPFATTFSNFATLRVCEHVRHFMGYMQNNIKLVGFGSGFAMGMFGITHYGIEDIASIRAINNIEIISPADCLEVYKAIISIAQNNKPTYLRLSGLMNNPIVYKEDYNFEIGKAITLKEGTDIAIIATGTMVNSSLKVAKILEEQGISTRVINMHTIKPIDKETILNCCDTKLIVTIEEHAVIGGLGSAVAEVLSRTEKKPRHLILGITDTYEHAGTNDYMLEQYKLTPGSLVDSILKTI
jgi:transketolase